MNGVESYALRHKRLHHKIVEFLQPFFDFDLNRVKVNAKLGNTSLLKTSVWVLADTIMVQRGKLNAEFEQWQIVRDDGSIAHDSNRAIDLATVHGMRILAHECYHVKQWLTRPWWSSFATIFADMLRSLWHERRLWSHARSKWEQEAIAFENGITPEIVRRSHELQVFETLR